MRVRSVLRMDRGADEEDREVGEDVGLDQRDQQLEEVRKTLKPTPTAPIR